MLLADDLNALGANAITRQERQQAFERLQVPPAAALTDATVIRIGQLVGAAQVVVGSLQLEDDTLVVRARSIALDTGRVQADVTERGPLPELFAHLRARRAPHRAAVDDDRRTRSSAMHPPVAVFEDYIKGLLAETPATAINYLNAALQRQPSFDRARLALWEVYAEQGDHERALAAVTPVPADSPLGAARALSRRAVAAAPEEVRRRVRDVQGAGRRASRRRPSSTTSGSCSCAAARTPQTGPADLLLQQGGRGRSRRSRLLLQSRLRLLARPRSAGRDLLAARSGAPQPGRRRRALRARRALAAGGNASEAARERELARRLSSTYRAGQAPGRRRGARRGSSGSRTTSSCRTPAASITR